MPNQGTSSVLGITAVLGTIACVYTFAENRFYLWPHMTLWKTRILFAWAVRQLGRSMEAGLHPLVTPLLYDPPVPIIHSSVGLREG